MPKNLHKWMPLLALFAVICGTPLLASGIHGKDLDTWLIIPFAGILISIAVLPLVAKHFWEHHFGKVSLAWSAVTVLALIFAAQGRWGVGDVIHDMSHVMLLDYVPFLILLMGLFVIAGGIRIKGRMRGSPGVNTMLLLVGTLLASWMGTTGAAMLMIRPILHANDWRKHKTHVVVFFIFLVCNIGGSLTPLGDPPLFMGFLRGVPFDWTLVRAAPETAVLTVILLVVFFAIDFFMVKKEELKEAPAEPGHEHEKFGIEGGINFLLLAALIGTIILSSVFAGGTFYDKDAAAKYDAVLLEIDGKYTKDDKGEVKRDADGDPQKEPAGLTGHLKKAVRAADAKKWDDAATLYASAAEAAARAHKAMPAEGDAHKAETKPETDAEKLHEAGDPLAMSEHDLETSKLDKKYGGGLSGRAAAIADMKAGTLAADKADSLKHLITRDYQRSVLWANGVRGEMDEAGTKAVMVPGIGVGIPYTNLFRDILILILVFLSMKITSKDCRKRNDFTWGPMKEVAKLFAGIFITMVPALKILAAGVDGHMAGVVDAVTSPSGEPLNYMYFWLSGALSSFLDNTPTYLVFFNTAGGDAAFLTTAGATTLLAVSLGSVFMGANTYIGNAPNFMVKSIAEEHHVKMPSFFGYMAWSIAILVPLFILITFWKFL